MRAPHSNYISTGALALLLFAAFMLGASMSSTIFLLWSLHSDQISILTTTHRNDVHNMGLRGNSIALTEPGKDSVVVLTETEKDSVPKSKNANTPLSKKTSSPKCPASGSIKCCESSIQNPPEKIDIVIPYQYMSPADKALHYELRSFEKHGLLDHVGTVYIIVENDIDAVLTEEHFQGYITKQKNNKADGSTKLRIVTMDNIQVPFSNENFKKDVKLAKSHYSPFLPDISEYYLLVPDDVVMLKEYSRDIWFDPKNKLPYAHGFGSWRGGNTHGFRNIAELHGVNFLNRCTMQYVIERYHVDKPNDLSPTAVAIGMMDKEKLLAGFYGYNSAKFASVGPHKSRFFKECHTNGGCRKPSNFGSEIFVNIQGEGVSFEYKRASSRETKMWSDWFNNEFPLPSRFEEVDSAGGMSEQRRAFLEAQVRARQAGTKNDFWKGN